MTLTDKQLDELRSTIKGQQSEIMGHVDDVLVNLYAIFCEGNSAEERCWRAEDLRDAAVKISDCLEDEYADAV